MGAGAMRSNRIAGWLLAITIVLPSLIGWLPMPMRAQAAVSEATAQVQDATARLLADLAVLCTPYGLRLAKHDAPGKPVGKLAHDSCVLCGLAANASLGVLHAAAAFDPPLATPIASAIAPPGPAPVTDFHPRPPSRGPPN